MPDAPRSGCASKSGRRRASFLFLLWHLEFFEANSCQNGFGRNRAIRVQPRYNSGNLIQRCVANGFDIMVFESASIKFVLKIEGEYPGEEAPLESSVMTLLGGPPSTFCRGVALSKSFSLPPPFPYLGIISFQLPLPGSFLFISYNLCRNLEIAIVISLRNFPGSEPNSDKFLPRQKASVADSRKIPELFELSENLRRFHSPKM